MKGMYDEMGERIAFTASVLFVASIGFTAYMVVEFVISILF